MAACLGVQPDSVHAAGTLVHFPHSMNKFGEVTQASVRPTPLTLPHDRFGALAVSNIFVVSI